MPLHELRPSHCAPRPETVSGTVNTLSRLLLPLLLPLLLSIGCSRGSLLAQTAQPQAPEPQPDSKSGSHGDADYHSTGAKQPGDWGAADKSTKPITAVAAHYVLGPLKEIKILPASIAITGPRYSQRLVVEGIFADGHQEDITDQARITASDPKVALVDREAFVRPQSDGKATVTAMVGGHRATAPVEIKQYSAPFNWSFRNDVLPVMTKMGCNSGPCHGAAAGKNGFKLTLRGYDPETDYYTLTHQALSRRTDRLEPAKSLILLKPTLTIPHGGGRRFPVGSLEYQVMSGWIAAGMPPPQASDARITDLQVLPHEASLRPGAKQQLLVTATFSDGHTEDVTRWVKFSSGDDGVATVNDSADSNVTEGRGFSPAEKRAPNNNSFDGRHYGGAEAPPFPNGLVTMHGAGEAPVTVWYLSHVTFARLRIPSPYKIEESAFDRAPRHNYIDDAVIAHLKVLHVPPSRPATDAEFIRRAYLDAAGILPQPREVEAFLKDTSPDKRDRLINALIARSEFVDYWAYKWSDLLLVSSNKLAPEGMWTYYNWIRESVAADKPWNRFVREIVTANGSARQNGAANYWVIHRDPKDISENMTQAFLGTTITCAHCHNHPLEKWTQKDYYGMANLFARVRLKTGAPGGFRPGVGPIYDDVAVITSPSGEYHDDRFGRPLPPKPLDAKALPFSSPEDPRDYFAQWLTSPDNPYFARAIVNRVWRNFMGRGLVDPVDDMRATNPPTNEELLSALTKDFVAHNFDVNYLIKTIMQSATFQTSSEPNKENQDDEKYYSHYLIRRLPAEVLLDALSEVTQSPEKFDGYPLGMRAMQLPDTAVQNYFLSAFGRPAREQTRESERTSDPSITQALHVINGDTLNEKLRAPDGTVDMLLRLGLSDEEMVNYLYLAAFSRYPTDSERAAIVNDLKSAEAQPVPGSTVDPRRAALIDMTWAFLTSKEFMFNH